MKRFQFEGQFFMAWFFCCLNAPLASFIADMTADERVVMRAPAEHGAKDPTILAKQGFSFSIFAMPHLTLAPGLAVHLNV